MAKLLYAGCTVGLPSGDLIPCGRRIPEGSFSAVRLAQLIADGAIVERDPLADLAEDEQLMAAPKPALDVSKPWTFDPALIANDSLDVLNIKMAERTAKTGHPPIEPFTDVEEARAWMSMDFVALAVK